MLPKMVPFSVDETWGGGLRRGQAEAQDGKKGIFY
jgi:hypothetical protein